jgi:hypothetical protein
LGARANQTQSVGQFGALAQRAVDGHADPLGASVGFDDPSSELEWRAVTDVLVVAAGKFGCPIALDILVVARNGSLHAPRLPAGWAESDSPYRSGQVTVRLRVRTASIMSRLAVSTRVHTRTFFARMFVVGKNLGSGRQ